MFDARQILIPFCNADFLCFAGKR
jgi:hypothetical protein